MTATNGDREWHLGAGRGDIQTEGAFEYVRAAAAVRATWEASDPELARAFDEGDARYPDDDRRRPALEPPVDVDQATTATFTRRNGLPPGPDDLLVGVRTGAWLDAQDFPPLRYHVPGLLTEGSSLLVGPPKIGKSWLVLAVALAVAAGGRALGIPVDARPVLYMALEDGHRRMQDRCRTLLAGGRIPAAFEYLTTVQPGTVVATIEAWLARHPGAEPLVILDTLGKVMPPALVGESSYARDYRVGSVLKRLADEQPGAALLVNHHDRKAAADDFVDAVSGTHGLAGAADSIIVLTRPRHDTAGTLKITGRDVAEGEYAVNFMAGSTWQLDGDDLRAASSRAALRRASAGIGDRSIEVIDFVGKYPEGVRPTDVEAALGIPEARRYMARLAESGRLVRVARGLYALPVPLSQPSHRPDTPHTRDTTPRLVTETGQRDTWDTATDEATEPTPGPPAWDEDF